MYSIKEISEMFDIPSSTLRYYEELGILSNVTRTKSNQRIYTEENISKLNAITCFKNSGMTLLQIKLFFEYEIDEYKNIDNMLSLLSDHENKILLQINELQSSYMHIQNKIKFYNAVKESLNNGNQPPMWDDFFSK